MASTNPGNTSSFLSASRFLDLTWNLTEEMPVWEKGGGFKKKMVISAENSICTIHEYTFAKGGIGTHFDSAGHFVPGKRMVHEYNASELICPLYVIDIAAACERNQDYLLSEEDVRNFEKQHGRIRDKSCIVLNSGWSQWWVSGQGRFVREDSKGIKHFPGWSKEAARVMNERNCYGLGTDCVSIDAGYKFDLKGGATQETAFDAHLEILRQDKYLLENVKIVDGLPSEGATLIVAPIPIEGGSEAPCRLYAYV